MTFWVHAQVAEERAAVAEARLEADENAGRTATVVQSAATAVRTAADDVAEMHKVCTGASICRGPFNTGRFSQFTEELLTKLETAERERDMAELRSSELAAKLAAAQSEVRTTPALLFCYI